MKYAKNYIRWELDNAMVLQQLTLNMSEDI